jgi:hypothetical protein
LQAGIWSKVQPYLEAMTVGGEPVRSVGVTDEMQRPSLSAFPNVGSPH